MGRPSLYTEEKADKVCEYIGKGLPVELAAQFVGVSAPTIINWRAAHPDFDVKYNEALKSVIMHPLTCLMLAGQTDPDFALKFLMRRFPKWFGTFEKFQNEWDRTNDPVSREEPLAADDLTKALERDDRIKKQ